MSQQQQQTIPIDKIIINGRYRKDLGNLKKLAKSIVEIGLLHPIVINENNELIAGQRRIEAFKILDRHEIPVHQINLKDILKGELHENFIKKDFTSREIIDIKRTIEPLERKEAKERQKTLNNEETASENFSEANKGNALDKIASFVEMSRPTLNKLEEIVDAAEENPEQFGDLPENIDAKKISIERAFQMVNRSEVHKPENIPELPQGQFDIILADPPWQYDVTLRGSPENHYQTMDIEDIKQMQVPSSANAILFLWTTTAMLKKSLDVMDTWNFEYKTHIVWIKNKIGLGYFVRGKHELLMIGVKGKMPLPETDDRPESVLIAEVREHSKKPDEVYNIIEKMYPNRTYLELFARSQHNDNWSVWGIEAPAPGLK